MGAAVALKVTFGKRPLSSATTLSFHNINLFVVVSPCYSVSLYYSVRGALKTHFRKKLGFWPNKGGGGLSEAQVFVEIFQKQICLGKWPEM